MVKYIISTRLGTEMTKFSREFNTYGVGEELLYPVQKNDSSIGQPQPVINLATYLINFQEFQKSNVEIKRNGNKVWLFYTSKYNRIFVFETTHLIIVGELGGERVQEELPPMNYYFVPVIIITLGAYFIADVFFGVYEMAVDTLFLCFLEVELILKLKRM